MCVGGGGASVYINVCVCVCKCPYMCMCCVWHARLFMCVLVFVCMGRGGDHN